MIFIMIIFNSNEKKENNKLQTIFLVTFAYQTFPKFSNHPNSKLNSAGDGGGGMYSGIKKL